MSNLNITEYVRDLCLRAKEASYGLAVTGTAERNGALAAIAGKLRENVSLILAENEKDLASAEVNGVPKTMPQILPSPLLCPTRFHRIWRALQVRHRNALRYTWTPYQAYQQVGKVCRFPHNEY